MKLQSVKIAGLLLLWGLSPLIGLSQLKVPGIPESFNSTDKNAVIIPLITLDSIYPELLVKEDFQLGITNRYGKVQPLTINLKGEGISSKIAGKGIIWRYRFIAPDAISLGVQFSTFHIPEGASLYLYDPSGNNVLGAFTSLNNKEDYHFAIADFPGNEVVVEYFEPDSAEFPGEVILGDLSLAYKNILSAESSNQVWINCPEGADWQVEKKSVCMITFIEGRNSYICSGSLLNNVRRDGTPYFLTANHCISSNTVAKTIITYFNYENSTCSSDDASLEHTLSGATLKANGSASDFSLLLLSENPPEDYTPYFAGWDATGSNPENGTCIHHPDGKPKSIAIDNDKILGNSGQIMWEDYSVSKINSHWAVNFETGFTEIGSSGSPLFNEERRVVGQLHGGDEEESLYGKFSLSWANNTASSQQLKAWLDPDNSGTYFIDGMGGKSAPKASFSSQMAIACTGNAVQLSDKSWYSPTKWLWRISPDNYRFVQNTDSTSQNPEVEFLQEKKYSIELISSNNFGSDRSVVRDFIDVRDNLPVQFYLMPADTTLCACDLEKLPLIGTGAYSYDYSLSDSSYIIPYIQSDTLYFALNGKAGNMTSFSTVVTVKGSHGSCAATDTLFLHVVQEKNDNIANAIPLSPGRNTAFSNRCGTVESNEPSPISGNCYSQVSWCAGEEGGPLSNTVWFSFYGPTNGKVTIDAHGFDTQVAVYKSLSGSEAFSSFDDLDEVAANDNRTSKDAGALIEELVVEPGTKYWIQLDGRNGAYGNATIDLISNSAEVFPTVSADGLFTLYLSSADEGKASYEVYNALGQKLTGNAVAYAVDNSKISLDLSFCSKGVYMLRVTMGDIVSIHKIAIQ